jgi:hypothetical protein
MELVNEQNVIQKDGQEHDSKLKLFNIKTQLYLPSLFFEVLFFLLLSVYVYNYLGFFRGLLLAILMLSFVWLFLLSACIFFLLFWLFCGIEGKIVNQFAIHGVDQFSDPFLKILAIVRTQLYFPFIYIYLFFLLNGLRVFDGVGILRNPVVVFPLVTMITLSVFFFLPFVYVKLKVKNV